MLSWFKRSRKISPPPPPTPTREERIAARIAMAKRWNTMPLTEAQIKRITRGVRFGTKPTHYQNQVNSLTGALGPKQPAFWKNTYKMTGPAYSMGSQPLYYAPSKGFYVTSADVPAANYSVDFSNFGFGRKRRSVRRRRRSRRSRRSVRRRRRSRKHR